MCNTLLVFCLVQAVTSSLGAPTHLSSKGTQFRIVSTRPTFDISTARPRSGTPTEAIAVDANGNVVELGLRGDGGTVFYGRLGYEYVPPTDFPSSRLLPKDEVLVRVRRLTCPDRGWRLWVTESIGFSESQLIKGKGFFLPYRRVRAFHESEDRFGVVLEKAYFDVTDLIFADINHDGRTEIVVHWVDEGFASPSTYLDIWWVDPTGKIFPVPLDNVMRDANVEGRTRMEMGLGPPRDADWGLFTLQVENLGRKRRLLRKFYDWDKAKRSYVLSDSAETQETDIK